MKRLRKVGNRIYLGIFKLKLMKWLDHFLYANVFKEAPDDSFKTTIFVYPNEEILYMDFIHIDSTGEAFLILDTSYINDSNCGFKDHYIRYDLSEKALQKMLEYQLEILKSFKIFDKNDTCLENYDLWNASYWDGENELRKKHITNIKIVLKGWAEDASEKALKQLGYPLDPIKAAQYDFTAAWNEYKKTLSYFGDSESDLNMKSEKIAEIFRKTLK